MRQIVFAAKWFFMLEKRLVKRYSFLIILLIIPLMLPAARLAMEKDKGVLSVALCAKNDDELAGAVIDKLMSDESVIHYIRCENEEEGINLLYSQKADALWSFADNFKERTDKYDGENSKTLVRVFEREETIPLQLSREKLYGAVYPYISYSIFKNFTYNELGLKDKADDAVLHRYYDAYKDSESVIEIKKLNDEKETDADNNYLLTPMRGILSLLIALSALAAAMYFLQDESEGRYAWLANKKKTVPAFANCLAAAVLSGIAVAVAIFLAGINTDAMTEIVSMLLYILQIAFFGLVLCMLFRSPMHLGVLIPFFMIVMLALCPIFLNVKILRPVRLLLPPYYYLMAVHDKRYFLYMLIYCAAALAASQILNMILKREN